MQSTSKTLNISILLKEERGAYFAAAEVSEGTPIQTHGQIAAEVF